MPRAGESSPSLSFQLQVENRLTEVRDQISKSIQDVKSRLADHSSRLKTLEQAVAFIQAEIRSQRSTPGQIQSDEVRLLREDVNSLLENQGARSGQVPRLEDLPPQGESNFSDIQARLDGFERTLSHLEAENSRRDVPVSGTVKSKARTSKKNKSRKSKKKSAKVQDEPSSSDPSSTSSTDDSDGYSSSDSGSSTSEHGKRRKPRAGRHSRSRPSRLLRRGPKHPGLKELPSTNILFERLLSYRSYRLKKTSSKRTARETGKVKDHIKRLEVSFKNRHFDGKDPIMVFDCLSRFVKECDILEMSEAQAYIAVAVFLKGLAADQFKSVRDSPDSNEGGVTCWPESVAQKRCNTSSDHVQRLRPCNWLS